jgi:hypothetical protein
VEALAPARLTRRSVDALIKAGVIKRATAPHLSRPKSRECPRDGHRFHVELLDAKRPLNEAAPKPIVDAARPLNAGDSGRLTVEIADAKRPLHRETTEEPPTRENPDLSAESDLEHSSLSVVKSFTHLQRNTHLGDRPTSNDEAEKNNEDPPCKYCGVSQSRHDRWAAESGDPHPYIPRQKKVG